MSVIRELIGIYFDKKIGRAAAQLAYYLTLSIFPLLICVNAMLGKMNLSEADLLVNLQGIIPAAAYTSIMDYVGYISSNFSATMLIMALTILVTSASAGFRAILTVMAEIQDEHRFIGFWKTVFSIIFSIGFLVSIYMSCIVIITGDWFITFITNYTGKNIFSRLWSRLRFVVLFLLLLVIVYGIYKISAPKERPHRQRIVGALAASLIMVCSSMFFSWTIGLSAKYPLIYGSLASMIILMIWLFICGNILIMGNAFNVVLNRHRERRRYIRRRSADGMEEN